MFWFFLGGLVDTFQNRFKVNKKLLTIASILLFVMGVISFIKVDKVEFAFYMILPATIYLFAEYFSVPAFMYKFIEALGNLTYAIYLLHFPIQIGIVLVYAYFEKAIPYYSNIFFISFMAFTLLFSRLTFLKLEMPAQSYFRRKFLKKRNPTAKDVEVN